MSPLPLLAEPSQLAERLDDPGLLIVDMRGADGYRLAHIPGAVALEYGDIVAAAPPVGGLLPPVERLSGVLGAAGLSPEKHVVAYDDEGNGRAARLLWTLDALGHSNVSLLDGGLVAWHEEGRPLERGPAPATAGLPPYPAAQYANPDVVADKTYIPGRLGAADFLPLDTRTPAEYRGEDVRSQRGGHIPGAVNFNFLEAIDRERGLRLKPEQNLREMLEALGATPDKEIVAYCQTHHRSSHACFVLRRLGYPRVRGYAGAWSDWGNDPGLPVEA